MTVAIKTEVFCTITFEAIHCWPDCSYEEVAYLQTPHRHVFHVKAWKPVCHDDRDVEFIMLKHRIQKYVNEQWGEYPDLGAMSCEMIATQLLEAFDLSKCEVSEDGENGAVVTTVQLGFYVN